MKPIQVASPPSSLAHFIVVLLLLTSIIVPLIMCVQFFKADGSLERTWDGLARWVDDALED